MLRSFLRVALACGFCAVFAAGCEPSEETAETEHALSAVCTDQPDELRPQAWLCPDAHSVECTGPEGAHVSRIYVWDGTAACDELPLLDVAPGPFAVGEHKIVVMAESKTVCIADLDVVDTAPPAMQPAVVELWPPNHTFWRITPDDCARVRDVCDPNVRTSFLYVASDEPEDDVGDGATLGDVRVHGCDAVDIRAERQGGGNGRVYTLGVRAVDASGNFTDGVCRVIVPHDQSGAPVVEDDPSYTAAVPVCG